MQLMRQVEEDVIAELLQNGAPLLSFFPRIDLQTPGIRARHVGVLPRGCLKTRSARQGQAALPLSHRTAVCDEAPPAEAADERQLLEYLEHERQELAAAAEQEDSCVCPVCMSGLLRKHCSTFFCPCGAPPPLFFLRYYSRA